MKHELQNIISGKSPVGHGNTIQAISRYLRKSKSTGGTTKPKKQIKREEATLIKQFCDKNSFWIIAINTNNFVSSGATIKGFMKNTVHAPLLLHALFL